MTWLLGLTILSYCCLVIWVFLGIRRLDNTRPAAEKRLTRFTIVVPFRNEASRITPLLRSITQLDYPRSLFEIIFVNDESVDQGEVLIKDTLDAEATPINYCILDNERRSGSPKKDAITLAVETSKMDWIACTDADCILPPRWLKNMEDRLQDGDLQGLIGGIRVNARPNLMEQLQLIEQLGLQQFAKAGVGWKRPILSNGANLAYCRQAFMDVNGYQGNDHLASGDDQFLVEKLSRNFPGGVSYIAQEAHLVTTYPQQSWNGLIQQRVRWASKQTRNGPGLSRLLGIFIFLINLGIPLGFLMTFTSSLSWSVWAMFCLIKILLDCSILAMSTKTERESLHHFFIPFVSLIYPVIMGIVALQSLGGSFNWKQRAYQNQQ